MLAQTRARSSTIFHPSGTCTMGPATNPMAVVDPELRVHGLSGPRIAEASIMPDHGLGQPQPRLHHARPEMRGDDARGALRVGA